MPYLYYEQPAKKFLPSVKLVNSFSGKKILAFSPHSDDLSIGAGGFLAELSRSNSIQPVLAYAGWRGVDGNLSPERATQIREDEMREEARILRIEPPKFLRLSTYEKNLSKTRAADRETLRGLVLKERPDMVFLPNSRDIHPRHALLTRLVASVLRGLKFKGEVFFYEIPWSIFSGVEINFIVPLKKEWVERKILAIRSHKSQLKRTDFVRLTKALLALRAGMVPEQKIGGYGSSIDLGRWVEVYKYKRVARNP